MQIFILCNSTIARGFPWPLSVSSPNECVDELNLKKTNVVPNENLPPALENVKFGKTLGSGLFLDLSFLRYGNQACQGYVLSLCGIQDDVNMRNLQDILSSVHVVLVHVVLVHICSHKEGSSLVEKCCQHFQEVPSSSMKRD
ncbi:hypothetical protein VNO77_20026 [Canavalia gladiata]|uniref:Uncharacterized protein n=1 Tax=Canavalia gladiata TaxID=3824 RepID=A0AAN9QKX7_CANGL